MTLLPSVEKIAELWQDVKSRQGTFITNFFADSKKISYWFNNKKLYFKSSKSGFLLFRKADTFYHLYFFTSSLAELHELLDKELPDKPLVIDLIGKTESVKHLVDIFLEAGFDLHTVLHRFMRYGDKNEDVCILFSEVMLAANEDAFQIDTMFKQNFDSISEQLPDILEIDQMILEKKVLVVKISERVVGFLIRTVIGHTTILNNFLVHKNFRGNKIGSKLLRYYISESKLAKRMLLWVKFDNITAIDLYRQNGYMQDELVDYVLKKKQ